MKQRVKNTLRAMAGHLGLKVKFVDYLDETTHGRLLIRERRILINARKPRPEHIFTILHEIGHFVVHHQHRGRDRCPWYFRQDWNNEFLSELCAKVRRHLRFLFNRHAGREWEADLWAMCAFFALAKQLGCRTDLTRFLELHPEKFNLSLLAIGALSWSNAKKQLGKLSHCLRLPFKST